MTRFGIIEGGKQTSVDNGGSGPEDPMLEQRVANLETDMKRVLGILVELQPKITETLLTGAKQADIHKLQLDVAEMKGRITGVEGRISGLDSRIGALPTTWTMLAIVFTTWAIGSGILLFAINVLRK